MTLSGPNWFLSADAPAAGRRGQPVTVHYETADGTATAGQDYTRRLRRPHLRSRRPGRPPSPWLSRSRPTTSPMTTRPSWSICRPRSTASCSARTATVTITDTPPPTQEPGYVPLTPVRLLDTRNGTGAPAGFAAAGSTTELQVSGAAGIPATAKAVVFNATVTQPEAAGYLTVFPCGESRPTTSNINYITGQTIANMVVVALPCQRQGLLLHQQEGPPDRRCERILLPDFRLRADVSTSAGRYALRGHATGQAAGWQHVQCERGGQVRNPGRCGGSLIERDRDPAECRRATSPRSPAELQGQPPARSTTWPDRPYRTLCSPRSGAAESVHLHDCRAPISLVDVAGWFPAGTDFHSLTPERLLDTRSGIGHAPAGIVPAKHRCRAEGDAGGRIEHPG